MPRLYSLALFLILLLAGRPASAQSRPAVDPPWVPDTTRLQPEAVAAPDTAVALHRLFAGKRGLRVAVVAGTALVYVVAVAAGPEKYGSYDGTFVRVFNYSPIALGALIGEFAYFGRYSRRRERQAIEAWRAHRLAPVLRRRLAPHYFEPNGPRQP